MSGIFTNSISSSVSKFPYEARIYELLAFLNPFPGLANKVTALKWVSQLRGMYRFTNVLLFMISDSSGGPGHYLDVVANTARNS